MRRNDLRPKKAGAVPGEIIPAAARFPRQHGWTGRQDGIGGVDEEPHRRNSCLFDWCL